MSARMKFDMTFREGHPLRALGRQGCLGRGAIRITWGCCHGSGRRVGALRCWHKWERCIPYTPTRRLVGSGPDRATPAELPHPFREGPPLVRRLAEFRELRLERVLSQRRQREAMGRARERHDTVSHLLEQVRPKVERGPDLLRPRRGRDSRGCGPPAACWCGSADVAVERVGAECWPARTCLLAHDDVLRRRGRSSAATALKSAAPVDVGAYCSTGW